jgi:hypothetical protein
MTASQFCASFVRRRVVGGVFVAVLGGGLCGLATGCANAEPFRTNASISSEDGSGRHGGGGSVDAGHTLADVDQTDQTPMGGGGFGGSAGALGSGGVSGGSGGAAGAGTGGVAGGGSGGIGGGGQGGAGMAGAAGMSGTGGSGGQADAGTGGQAGAGTGGSGGATIDGCSRPNWTFTATMLCDTPNCVNIPASQKDPRYAIDGDAGTRYTSGRPQGSAGQEKVVLTFSKTVTVTGLQLMTSAPGDGAAAYKVEYATTGTNFVGFVPAVAGTGSDDIHITFPTTAMNALRITQTGTKTGPWWSIHELVVTGCLNN